VTVQLAEKPLQLAVITAEPAATPVTTPPDTIALEPSEVLQDTVPIAVAGTSAAVSVVDSPMPILAVVGVTVTPVCSIAAWMISARLSGVTI
jgi:hypothetical protein